MNSPTLFIKSDKNTLKQMIQFPYFTNSKTSMTALKALTIFMNKWSPKV